MSEENDGTVLGLADIIREWIRGDPTLNEHFFVHKQTDMTSIHMNCDGRRTIAGFQYTDYPELRDHKNRWFIGIEILDLNPAKPTFFSTVEKYLKIEHNRFLAMRDCECKKRLS